jgi:hypothetical protein
MQNDELLDEIHKQQAIMIEVATGQLRIQDANEEYTRRRILIQQELKQRNIDEPNPFTDLWKWYGKWKNDLPSYQSRREYISDLYDPIVELVQTSPSVSILPRSLIALIDELDNFEFDYNSYISESGCEHLIDNILHAKIVALQAFLTHHNITEAISLINDENLQSGKAVFLLEAIKSYIVPVVKNKISAQSLDQSGQEVAINLRKHLLLISDHLTSKFLEEAIICFEQRLYRAAVVMAWVGAISLLHEYVFVNHLVDFNTEALRRNPKWKPAKTTDDLSKMKEFDFLEVLEAISVIGKNVKQELQTCLQLRNGCGHPNSLQIGQNKVAAHLESLTLNVFAEFS